MEELIVIGGGLAGAEAAWQAAIRGVHVILYEMRPGKSTGAHRTGDLAELICSNSLGSNLVERASGLLKAELRRLGSFVIECADQTCVPAGRALAVDRNLFAEMVTRRIQENPNIQLVREELKEIPSSPVVVASGPLTSTDLSMAIQDFLGIEHLYFYDAIAPIVLADSINLNIAFLGSRYSDDSSGGDYLNCPLSKEEYDAFTNELVKAERIELREFEEDIKKGVRAGYGHFFEGCLPIEILAQRDQRALAFGPLRPVGLSDPKTGRRPYANVQLRQDNLSASMYNLVGFQTNLTFPEQKRIFRMIPGLEKAEFARYGQMHRNTFINSPVHLKETLQSQNRNDCFFAGQITGVEGYVGNVATGLLAGWNAVRVLKGEQALAFPRVTMLGALCYYISHASVGDFQPMKASYGLLPALEPNIFRDRKKRVELYTKNALASMDDFLLDIEF